jgi:hypothetical protein
VSRTGFCSYGTDEGRACLTRQPLEMTRRGSACAELGAELFYWAQGGEKVLQERRTACAKALRQGRAFQN